MPEYETPDPRGVPSVPPPPASQIAQDPAPQDGLNDAPRARTAFGDFFRRREANLGGTAPAVNPPTWSGKKTAIAAALAIGVAGVGTVAAANSLPAGSGAGSDGLRGGRPGQMGQQVPGGSQGQVPGQPGQGQFGGQDGDQFGGRGHHGMRGQSGQLGQMDPNQQGGQLDPNQQGGGQMGGQFDPNQQGGGQSQSDPNQSTGQQGTLRTS